MYVLAALWSIAGAICQTQINALYGVVFVMFTVVGYVLAALWGIANAYLADPDQCPLRRCLCYV